MKALFRKLLKASSPLVRHLRTKPTPAAGEILVEVEQSWSDDHGIGLHGWVLCRHGAPADIEILVDGRQPQIVTWHDRPDLHAHYPQFASTPVKCGFSAYIPRTAQHAVTFQLGTHAGSWRKELLHVGQRPGGGEGNRTDGGALFSRFIELANQERYRVMEIGSRVVSPGSTDKRRLFPRALEYVGFDYYRDANTDVVGDAHQLSAYFPAGTEFDAVFSISVLEHLAMPWVAAMEINRMLKKGGHTFHATHFAWPLHETPWDFWRFSDSGLKALFSPALGFEVVEAGLFTPLRLHADSVHNDHVALPYERAYGGVAILARKISDVDSANFRWTATLDQVVGADSKYPPPKPPLQESSDRSLT